MWIDARVYEYDECVQNMMMLSRCAIPRPTYVPILVRQWSDGVAAIVVVV